MGFALLGLNLPCSAQQTRQLAQTAPYNPPVHITPGFPRSFGPATMRFGDDSLGSQQATHAQQTFTKSQSNVRQTAAEEQVRSEVLATGEIQPAVAPARQLQQPARTAAAIPTARSIRTAARQDSEFGSGRTLARPVSILNRPAQQETVTPQVNNNFGFDELPEPKNSYPAKLPQSSPSFPSGQGEIILEDDQSVFGLGDEGADGDENVRSRLNELIDETENDLRGRGTGTQLRMNEPRSDRTQSLLDDLGDDLDIKSSGTKSSLLDKSCDDFRADLLDNPLRNISLDMSPPSADESKTRRGITRNWTDRGGNPIATGTMVDLRRSYIILDDGQRIPFARLSDADLAAVGDYWQMPTICSVGNRGYVERNWIPQTYTLTASSLCHKPLYFENVQLERYGHTHGPIMQPVRSVGHFFVSLVFLPYQTAIHPANECQYALGYYRPGDCAPWLKDPIPISLRGAGRQAGIVTGLSFIP